MLFYRIQYIHARYVLNFFYFNPHNIACVSTVKFNYFIDYARLI